MKKLAKALLPIFCLIMFVACSNDKEAKEKEEVPEEEVEEMEELAAILFEPAFPMTGTEFIESFQKETNWELKEDNELVEGYRLLSLNSEDEKIRVYVGEVSNVEEDLQILSVIVFEEEVVVGDLLYTETVNALEVIYQILGETLDQAEIEKAFQQEEPIAFYQTDKIELSFVKDVEESIHFTILPGTVYSQ